MTLRSRMFLVGAIAFVVALLAIDARSTYGARVSSDEPQYLLTAMSLGDDFDLDISDELEAEAYRDFHEVRLNQQTIDLNESGQRISPHDPLLPLILAIPMKIGGWQGAKVMLALIVGLTSASTLWFAIRRLAVPDTTATWVVGAFFTAPPLTSYGSQIFPAGPAALAVVVGAIAVTSPKPSRRTDALALASIVALPWLSVKYGLLVAVLTAALAWQHREDRRRLLRLGGILAAMGVIYLLFHREVYGGWTVYASGDHFVNGEFDVVGNDPNYFGRSRRLIGLLIDRGFGIAAWTPAFIVMPVAVVAVARRTRQSVVPLALIAAGWATATWVALTMHGWWWPGRQITPILPLVAVAIAAWVGPSLRRRAAVVAATLLGTITWLVLAWEASTDRRTIIFDFEQTGSPWYQAVRHILPNHMDYGRADALGTLVWVVILATVTGVAIRNRRQDSAITESSGA
ncbi:MAG: hypothetical protein AAF548_09220 [Actinomycetota bacterium]